MAEFATSNIRNVAFMGHGSEGKTTLTEIRKKKSAVFPSALPTLLSPGMEKLSTSLTYPVILILSAN